MNFLTIPELYHNTCKKNADKIAYKYKNNNNWEEITYNEFINRVECLAIGLMDLGLHKGDRIGLVSENRIEWIISAAAISMIGAIDVPLFPNSTPKQEEMIFNDCQATAVIVSNNYQLNKILEIKDNVSSIRHIIVMNEKISSDEVYVKKWTDIVNRGENLKTASERKNILQAIRTRISQDDIVTLIYTSGTTGDSKGVMLTNKNLIANCIGSMNSIKVSETDSAMSYLPFCHSFERMVTLYVLFTIGTTTAIATSIDTLITEIAEIKPTFMTTVPKFLDTVKKKIFTAMSKEPLAKRKIFDWAVSIGTKYTKARF